MPFSLDKYVDTWSLDPGMIFGTHSPREGVLNHQFAIDLYRLGCDPGIIEISLVKNGDQAQQQTLTLGTSDGLKVRRVDLDALIEIVEKHQHDKASLELALMAKIREIYPGTYEEYQVQGATMSGMRVNRQLLDMSGIGAMKDLSWDQRREATTKLLGVRTERQYKNFQILLDYWSQCVVGQIGMYMVFQFGISPRMDGFSVDITIADDELSVTTCYADPVLMIGGAGIGVDTSGVLSQKVTYNPDTQCWDLGEVIGLDSLDIHSIKALGDDQSIADTNDAYKNQPNRIHGFVGWLESQERMGAMNRSAFEFRTMVMEVGFNKELKGYDLSTSHDTTLREIDDWKAAVYDTKGDKHNRDVFVQKQDFTDMFLTEVFRYAQIKGLLSIDRSTFDAWYGDYQQRAANIDPEWVLIDDLNDAYEAVNYVFQNYRRDYIRLMNGGVPTAAQHDALKSKWNSINESAITKPHDKVLKSLRLNEDFQKALQKNISDMARGRLMAFCKEKQAYLSNPDRLTEIPKSAPVVGDGEGAAPIVEMMTSKDLFEVSQDVTERGQESAATKANLQAAPDALSQSNRSETYLPVEAITKSEKLRKPFAQLDKELYVRQQQGRSSHLLTGDETAVERSAKIINYLSKTVDFEFDTSRQALDVPYYHNDMRAQYVKLLVANRQSLAGDGGNYTFTVSGHTYKFNEELDGIPHESWLSSDDGLNPLNELDKKQVLQLNDKLAHFISSLPREFQEKKLEVRIAILQMISSWASTRLTSAAEKSNSFLFQNNQNGIPLHALEFDATHQRIIVRIEGAEGSLSEAELQDPRNLLPEQEPGLMPKAVPPYPVAIDQTNTIELGKGGKLVTRQRAHCNVKMSPEKADELKLADALKPTFKKVGKLMTESKAYKLASELDKNLKDYPVSWWTSATRKKHVAVVRAMAQACKKQAEAGELSEVDQDAYMAAFYQMQKAHSRATRIRAFFGLPSVLRTKFREAMDKAGCDHVDRTAYMNNKLQQDRFSVTGSIYVAKALKQVSVQPRETGPKIITTPAANMSGYVIGSVESVDVDYVDATDLVNAATSKVRVGNNLLTAFIDDVRTFLEFVCKPREVVLSSDELRDISDGLKRLQQQLAEFTNDRKLKSQLALPNSLHVTGEKDSVEVGDYFNAPLGTLEGLIAHFDHLNKFANEQFEQAKFVQALENVSTRVGVNNLKEDTNQRLKGSFTDDRLAELKPDFGGLVTSLELLRKIHRETLESIAKTKLDAIERASKERVSRSEEEHSPERAEEKTVASYVKSLRVRLSGLLSEAKISVIDGGSILELQNSDDVFTPIMDSLEKGLYHIANTLDMHRRTEPGRDMGFLVDAFQRRYTGLMTGIDSWGIVNAGVVEQIKETFNELLRETLEIGGLGYCLNKIIQPRNDSLIESVKMELYKHLPGAEGLVSSLLVTIENLALKNSVVLDDAAQLNMLHLAMTITGHCSSSQSGREDEVAGQVLAEVKGLKRDYNLSFENSIIDALVEKVLRPSNDILSAYNRLKWADASRSTQTFPRSKNMRRVTTPDSPVDTGSDGSRSDDEVDYDSRQPGSVPGTPGRESESSSPQAGVAGMSPEKSRPRSGSDISRFSIDALIRQSVFADPTTAGQAASAPAAPLTPTHGE